MKRSSQLCFRELVVVELSAQSTYLMLLLGNNMVMMIMVVMLIMIMMLVMVIASSWSRNFLCC